MKPQSADRRHFIIKASLAVPLLSKILFDMPVANAFSVSKFVVPENIHQQLMRIYGEQANNIVSTNKLKLITPEIAENGAVVPISAEGEKGLFISLVVFVAKNPKPFTSKATLHEGTDLPVSFRIKMAETSDVYLIAKTRDGLVGDKKTVKLTVGCGGC